MPIPSYPENRREEYLNNIATGSGEIPPYPENREEQYLDAIARNGGGGGSSGGGGLAVTVTASNGYYIMDKTWQEIHDAFCNGFAVAVLYTHRDVTETGENFQDTVDAVNRVEETFIKENGEFTDYHLDVYTSYLGGFEAQSKTDYPKSEIW